MVKLRDIPSELPVFAFRVGMEVSAGFDDLLMKKVAVKLKELK